VIRSIGLYWNADDVFWGRQKHRGRLLGVSKEKKKGKHVDFRDQIAVYVLYADFQPIYAGQVGSGKQRLFERLKQHRNGDLRGRWNRFSWYGLRYVLKSGKLSNENRSFHPSLAVVLNHVEGILVDATEPGQNRQSGRFGSEVEWFLQVRDEEKLGPSQSDILRQLYDGETKRQKQAKKPKKRART
jgi:hypothetical protein